MSLFWFVSDEREPFFSFGIGPSGSGVPFHTHGAVFAEVLHGAKRWFITQPRDKPVFDPNETSFRWLHRRSIAPQPHHLFDCTLYPGEVRRGLRSQPIVCLSIQSLLLLFSTGFIY